LAPIIGINHPGGPAQSSTAQQPTGLPFPAKSTRGQQDQNDQQNQARPATAIRRPAKIKPAATK
jgi:hypothetical protein